MILMATSSARSSSGHLAILAATVLAILYLAPAHAQKVDSAPRGAAQLEQLVAPIALYPDSLLSQVLMASTYPLEVVEAARWSNANAQLTGEVHENALQQQTWDPSVKALTTVPQTLRMMNDKLDWTQQLGDAFLAQQDDVLSAVQRLRARADANGQLKSTEHQKVTKVAAAPRSGTTPAAARAATVYTIEPANPAQYDVPIYDPGVVYGEWPYPDDVPFYWTPPGYLGAGALGYAAAALTGAAIWGGVDWGRNNINIDVDKFNRFNRTNIANGDWRHNPAHRGNVPYRDRSVAQRFGDPGKAAARDAFRGKAATGREGMASDTRADKRSNAGNKGARTTTGNAGKRATGAKQAAGSRQSAQSKQAKTKQAGSKSKQAGSKSKTGTKSAARSKQAAKSRQPAQSRASGARQATRPTHSVQRPQMGGPRPAMSRANTNLARGGGFSHGGFRGGARGGGGRRR
jgi:hypothetical protein